MQAAGSLDATRAPKDKIWILYHNLNHNLISVYWEIININNHYACLSRMSIITRRQHSLLCRCPVAIALAKASVRPSVRLSVCHTLLFYQNDASRPRITESSLPGPRRTLLRGSLKVFYKFERGHPDRGGWIKGRLENLRFLSNKSPYLRNGVR